MNIAILGGSFDPPHNGHVLVAKEVKKVLGISEVWLIPLYSHPFRKMISPAKKRFLMTSFLKNDFIKVLGTEINNPIVSYSIDTLTLLKKRYPEHVFYWIIGSDQVKDFPKWKDWKKILTDFHLVIFERTESPKELEALVDSTIPKNLQKNVRLVTSPTIETSLISSSGIREKVKHGESIANLVPLKVKSYIEKHNLYK